MAAMRSARGPGIDSQPRGEEVASYGTYAEAQRAVDYLSDQEFAVQAVTIVGTDLKMVERITGRLNYPRAALSGAASGAWFGLFVGLVMVLLTGGELLSTLGFALLIGAGFGMLFGVIAYALTGGKRDFTSSSQVVASSFALLCLPDTAGQARTLLRQLDGGTGHGERPRTPTPTSAATGARSGFARPAEQQTPPAGAPGDPAPGGPAAEPGQPPARQEPPAGPDQPPR